MSMTVLRVGIALLLCALPGFAQRSSPEDLRKAATAAQAQGKDAVAIELYRQALQGDATWTQGWWRYGTLLYEAHRFRDAEPAFARLTQLAPSNPLGFALLGLSEYHLSEWNNASLHLGKALNRGGLPHDIGNTAMYSYGLVLMRQSNRNGALILFRLLQHEAPQYPDLVLAFGAAQLGLEALPSPGDATYDAALLAGHAALAVLDLRTADAETSYGELVHKYPSTPYAHLSFALFLDNLGREDEAEAQLKAEAGIAPNEPDAWIWLARLALAHRNGVATREYASHALTLRPEDGLCYLMLGRSFVLDGQWSKALEALQKAEALAPNSYEVHYTLVSVYSALHEEQSAIDERKQFAATYAAAHPLDKGAVR